MAHDLAHMGGLFFLLTFWHFVVDWGCQTHAQGYGKAVRREVMVSVSPPVVHKERGYGKLTAHCLIYTLGMAPILVLLLPHWQEFAVAALLLFVSHMVGDTYLPVYLWFRYVRRPPLPCRTEKWSFAVAESMIKNNPGNLLLVTVIDQLYHLAFLAPVAMWGAFYVTR